MVLHRVVGHRPQHVLGHTHGGQVIVPAGLTNAMAIAGGMFHSLAVRSDGTVQELAHIGQVEMQAGDVFEIHTPGGGGFGQVGG